MPVLNWQISNRQISNIDGHVKQHVKRLVIYETNKCHAPEYFEKTQILVPEALSYTEDAMGSDTSLTKHGPKRDSPVKDRNRKRAVTGGVVIAVAAAAWFAFGKQYLAQRRLRSMETFVLKADNGAEAHVRPLGCCIQSRPEPCIVELRSIGDHCSTASVAYKITVSCVQSCWCRTHRESCKT